MNKRNILSASLSLMVTASLFTACGPAANQSATPDTSAPATSSGNANANANTNTNVNTGATVNTGSSASVSSQSQSSAELQAAMQAVVADEASFNDAETASDSSFSTQALEVEQSGEINATSLLVSENDDEDNEGTETNAGVRAEARANARVEARNNARNRAEARRTVAQARRVVVRAETRARKKAKAEMRKELLMNKKARLEASGAITVNADGTVTVKPAELKAFVKQNTQARREKFKMQKEKAQARLQNLREVAQEKKAQLRRKNNVVRVSDSEEITNEDGSITTVNKVEFTNERTGSTRTVVRTKTMMDGKMVSAFYELNATHKNHTRTVERSVEIGENGERNVKVTAMTTWNDGRKRERTEERIVAADGSAAGTGVVTVTRKDGTVKTYDYTIGVEANGAVSVNGDNNTVDETPSAEDMTEVTVELDADDSEATVIVEDGDEEPTEETLDLEADEEVEVEVEAEASSETEAEAN